MNTYELTLVLTEEAGKNEALAKKLASSLVEKIKGKNQGGGGKKRLHPHKECIQRICGAKRGGFGLQGI